MDSFSFALALIALLWTVYQQYHIDKIREEMCGKCPFFQSAQNSGEKNV